jgi:hypothetical protein
MPCRYSYTPKKYLFIRIGFCLKFSYKLSSLKSKRPYRFKLRATKGNNAARAMAADAPTKPEGRGGAGANSATARK